MRVYPDTGETLRGVPSWHPKSSAKYTEQHKHLVRSTALAVCQEASLLAS